MACCTRRSGNWLAEHMIGIRSSSAYRLHSTSENAPLSSSTGCSELIPSPKRNTQVFNLHVKASAAPKRLPKRCQLTCPSRQFHRPGALHQHRRSINQLQLPIARLRSPCREPGGSSLAPKLSQTQIDPQCISSPSQRRSRASRSCPCCLTEGGSGLAPTRPGRP